MSDGRDIDIRTVDFSHLPHSKLQVIKNLRTLCTKAASYIETLAEQTEELEGDLNITPDDAREFAELLRDAGTREAEEDAERADGRPVPGEAAS